jgi:hypothetical protein
VLYSFYQGNEKKIEKVIFDENLNYLHMVFIKMRAYLSHNSNSNVYMTVIRGTLP